MTEVASLFATTIEAYGTGRIEAGMEACERLLSVPGLPADIELATRRNQTWYLPQLAVTGTRAFREPPYLASREVTLPLVPQGWSRFNPSIAADPDGDLAMLVRSSNYTVDGEMRYTIHDAGDVIRTRNYVVRSIRPETLGVGDWYPINDRGFTPEDPPFPVSGYEDARLFWHEGWAFSATVRDRHPSGICQMVRCDLEDWDVVDEVVLSGRQRHEKNWMPVEDTNHFIAECGPRTISICDPLGGGWWREAPYIARAFRGGSQLVWDGGWTYLALVHEAVDLPGSIPARVYTHRFVEFGLGGYAIQRISLPFCFHGRGLEFAAGMVLVGGHLIISYGRDDASAWLFKLPLERALGMLKEPYLKICSVTMSRTASSAEVDEVVASVAPLVDEKMTFAVGELDDFARARNHMLETAAKGGYDWALMLDTDERIIWVDDVRDVLATTSADVLMVPHVSGTYEKERLFRLPAKGHFHGRTHEAFLLDAGAKRETIRVMAFDEVPKTPEQYRAKVERDLPLLKQMTEEDPDDPRWWYYLGDTYAGLGRADEALQSFTKCWARNGWDEESAWAMYRCAEIYAGREDYANAIYACANGMQRHPGMAELSWLAGWCCYQMGQYRKAIWWEEMALTLNRVAADQDRIGFRYPPALFEGPYDVLRHAYQALGDHTRRWYADDQFQVALAAREVREKIAAPTREDRVMESDSHYR